MKRLGSKLIDLGGEGGGEGKKLNQLWEIQRCIAVVTNLPLKLTYCSGFRYHHYSIPTNAIFIVAGSLECRYIYVNAAKTHILWQFYVPLLQCAVKDQNYYGGSKKRRNMRPIVAVFVPAAIVQISCSVNAIFHKSGPLLSTNSNSNSQNLVYKLFIEELLSQNRPCNHWKPSRNSFQGRIPTTCNESQILQQLHDQESSSEVPKLL